MRTDFQDVPVPELGGTEIRLYALTGTARAKLLAEMADLAGEDESRAKDPAVIARVFLFQGRAVGASMGYPESDWDGVPATLGSQAIERLFDVASELSGLGRDQQQKATARLGEARKRASGIGSPSH